MYSTLIKILLPAVVQTLKTDDLTLLLGKKAVTGGGAPTVMSGTVVLTKQRCERDALFMHHHSPIRIFLNEISYLLPKDLNNMAFKLRAPLVVTAVVMDGAEAGDLLREGNLTWRGLSIRTQYLILQSFHLILYLLIL